MSADTGVGPSMASGSQMCSGNIADLPAAPIKRSAIAHVAAERPRNEPPAREVTAREALSAVSSPKSNVPV